MVKRLFRTLKVVRFVVFAMLVTGLATGLTSCAATDEQGYLDLNASETGTSSHLQQAQKQFESGHFGLAERDFRAAVEEKPRDTDAWLGLAATYDKLRRFDLADRAYKRLRQLAGDTPEVLNNIGYSYLLRGDYEAAHDHISAAYARDPDNEVIQQNLNRLNEEMAKRQS